MLRLDNEMFLYHGSYCEVAVPNLSKCAAYKDFGKGFYLTTSKKQAEKFIGTALKKPGVKALSLRSRSMVWYRPIVLNQ